MIVVTGGAGFIGSYLIYELNKLGIDQIYIVDSFRDGPKWLNLRGLKYRELISPEVFWVEENRNRFKRADTIFHLGACSSTTEKNVDFLYRNNYQFSCTLLDFASYNNINFFYASSAATYGAGEHGYNDDHEVVNKLRPLNPYGYSKQLFDQHVLEQKHLPPSWAGLKFFNVFGPNEYHKGSMRSVVHQAFEQIQTSGKVKLFESYKPGIANGEQKRDFVSVFDAAQMMLALFEARASKVNGLFNIGTGVARSFNELVTATFKAMNKPVNIEYISMPENLRNQYQYFTEAPMQKMNIRFPHLEFLSLESSVDRYVKGYLMSEYKNTDLLIHR